MSVAGACESSSSMLAFPASRPKIRECEPCDLRVDRSEFGYCPDQPARDKIRVAIVFFQGRLCSTTASQRWHAVHLRSVHLRRPLGVPNSPITPSQEATSVFTSLGRAREMYVQLMRALHSQAQPRFLTSSDLPPATWNGIYFRDASSGEQMYVGGEMYVGPIVGGEMYVGPIVDEKCTRIPQ